MMLKSSSCNYIDAYILVNETIGITEAGADAPAKNFRSKKKTGNI